MRVALARRVPTWVPGRPRRGAESSRNSLRVSDPRGLGKNKLLRTLEDRVDSEQCPGLLEITEGGFENRCGSELYVGHNTTMNTMCAHTPFREKAMGM